MTVDPERSTSTDERGTSVYDASFDEVVSVVGPGGASDVYADLYRRQTTTHGVAAAAHALGVAASSLSIAQELRGSMSTKFLLDLVDGNRIEAVRIRRRDGYTACVSSQVGCAFGCRFCASGRLGLKRQLLPGEIVQQVLLLGRRVNRIVFMGIGEPLHNYRNVLAAIRILRDRRGLDFSTGGITISTIGIPDALRRLREEHLKVNLTVSLHATTNEVRHELIPGSRRHDVAEVVQRALSWAERHRRTVTFVYLVLPGVNDTDADLARLIGFARGNRARVNLMRWNPVEGGSTFRRASDDRLSHFRRRLLGDGVPTVVRDTQGLDIAAACGQLWLRTQSDQRTRPGQADGSTVTVPQARRTRHRPPNSGRAGAGSAPT